MTFNERGGRCSILTRRWSRASYNVTDAGIVSQLWVSRLNAWWSALSCETQSCETIPASVTLYSKTDIPFSPENCSSWPSRTNSSVIFPQRACWVKKGRRNHHWSHKEKEQDKNISKRKTNTTTHKPNKHKDTHQPPKMATPTKIEKDNDGRHVLCKCNTLSWPIPVVSSWISNEEKKNKKKQEHICTVHHGSLDICKLKEDEVETQNLFLPQPELLCVRVTIKRKCQTNGKHSKWHKRYLCVYVCECVCVCVCVCVLERERERERERGVSDLPVTK